ncbi:MAG: tetratricopeptide repeat protein [Anaerolineae bacterium]|jgi:tetratricopeptide (TPR) repeat protein
MTTLLHATEQDNLPIEQDAESWYTDPFDQRSLRKALKSLDDPETLGNHPLSDINIVRVQCESTELGKSDNPIARGIALRRILCDAIESLKPKDSTPDYLSKPWQPYLILTKQYVTAGRSPDYLADRMCVGRSTYYLKQEKALGLLANILKRMEQRYTGQGKTESDHQPPFTAPPRPAHTLVGRDGLMGTLKQRLFSHSGLALAALSGLPGVGKTALAIELAYDPDVLAHFKDGILWIGLGQRPDVFALLDIWGRALGMPTQEIAELTTIEERARLVHISIGLRRMLLIIDDAWQAEAALAFKLGGPNCAHLLTTRIPEVATVFSQDGAIVVHELEEDAGLALLEQLAPEAVRTEQAQARALVRAVGGLPLALTLMGNYLKKESLHNQPRRLRQAMEQLRRTKTRLQIAQPQPLLGRCPDIPVGISVSLETVIRVSDEAIDKKAQDTLQALSVFPSKPNSFSEESALAVADTLPKSLDILLDHGLLEDSGEGRYALHQAIADYARMRLAEYSGFQKAVCERMVSYFVRYAESHEKDYAALEPESENISAALRIAFEREICVEFARGANAFCSFLEAKGLYESAQALLTQTEQVVQSMENTHSLVTTLRNLGVMSQHLGDYTQAEAYLQNGLRMAHETGETANIVPFLENLGKVAFNCGDYARAEAHYHEGLAFAQRMGDRESHASLLENLGRVEGCRGDYALMETLFSKSMTLARESNNYARRCSLLTNLGLVAASRGNWPYAEMYLQEGLSLARRSDDLSLLGAMLINLGIVELHHGKNWTKAAALIKESLALYQKMRHHEKVRYLMNFSSAYIDYGQLLLPRVELQKSLALSHSTKPLRIRNQFINRPSPDVQETITLAITMARTALALAREIGHRERIGICLACTGMLELNFGDQTLAEEYLKEGLAIAREINNRQRIGTLLACAGAAAINAEDFAQAETYLQEGLTQAYENGEQARASLASAYLGVAAVGRRDYAQAEAHLEKSLAIAREIGLWIDVHALQSSLAAIHLKHGHLDQAEQYLREELSMAQEPEKSSPFTELDETVYLIGWGDLCLERGNLDAASEAFHKALTLTGWDTPSQDNPAATQDLSAIALYGLAQIAAESGDVAKAIQTGQESLEVFQALGSHRANEVIEWLGAL